MPLAARLNLPVVATHPVQFLVPDDFEAHEARVCVAEARRWPTRRVRRFSRDFKTQAQMAALFADIPSALANTLEIARRCNLTLVLGKPQLPDFPTPGSSPSLDDYFRRSPRAKAWRSGLLALFPDPANATPSAPLRRAAGFELATIVKMGFPATS